MAICHSSDGRGIQCLTDTCSMDLRGKGPEDMEIVYTNALGIISSQSSPLFADKLGKEQSKGPPQEMRAEKWRKGSRMSTLGNRVWEEWCPSLDTVVLGRGAPFCSSVTVETIFRYIAIQRYIYATGISSH